MKKILLFIIILNFFEGFTQEKIPSRIEKTTKSGLQFSDFKNSSDLFNFRFWNIGQVIEIRILSDSTKIGRITNFATKSYKSWKKQIKIESGKIDPIVYFQKRELTNSEISKVLSLIEKSQITELPSDNEIMNWKPVLDGECYSFEQKVGGIYKMKNYGNPRQQYELPEGVKFLQFYSELDDILHFNENFSDFFSNLDFGCYTKSGESQIICKKRKK